MTTDDEKKRMNDIFKRLVQVFEISCKELGRIFDKVNVNIDKQLKEFKEKDEWDEVPGKYITLSQFLSNFYKI